MRYLICRWRFILACMAFIPVSWEAMAQGNTVITYGTDRGVSSYMASQILTDHKGRLWVASPLKGLSIYDGNRWRGVDVSNGLLFNECRELLEDRFGNMWVNYGKFGCSRIFEGKIFNYELPQRIVGLYLNDDGTLSLISSEGGTFTSWSFDYKKSLFNKKQSLPDNYTLARDVYSHRFYFCPPKKSNLPWQYISNGMVQSAGSLPFPRDAYWISVMPDKLLYLTRDKVNIYEKGHLKQLQPDYFYSPYGPPVKINAQFVTFTPDKKHGRFYVIWSIGRHDYLLQEYSLHNATLITTVRYQSNYVAKVVTKDGAGNYWIGTENTVLKILSYQYTIPLSADGYLNSTWAIQQTTQGKFWISGFGSGFATFDGFRISQPPPSFDLFNRSYISNSTIRTDDGSMLFNVDQNPLARAGIISIKDDKWKFTPLNSPGIYFGRDRQGRLLHGRFDGALYIFKDGNDISDDNISKVIDKKKGLKLNTIVAAIQDHYGRFWMGRISKGIAMYDPTTDHITHWLIKNKVKDVNAVSIVEDTKGNLWFGGYGGLFFFENREKVDSTLDLTSNCIKVGDEYLGNSTIFSMIMADDSTMLIGNDNGYFLLDLNKFYHDRSSFSLRGAFLTKNENYTGSGIEQNCFIKASDGTYWMVTYDGIVSHDPSKYIPTRAPQEVFIDSVRVGNEVFSDISGKIKLANEQRTLSIHFSAGMDSLLYNDLTYQYRLNDNHWSPLTREDYVLFQNLNSGEYRFQLRALRAGNISPVKTLSFVILPPLWLRWQVWMGILIFVALLGLYLYDKQSKIYKQQLMLSQKQTEFEVMHRESDALRVNALVNQLNPHFINNALQWLQVRMGKDVDSVRMISRLAENISLVFSNSLKKVGFHSLRDELRLTANYLYIQSVRFGKGLEYVLPELEYGSEIGNMQVPIMMIQVHVENAVEHGIRNTETGNGNVCVTVREEGGYIIITVEDNGIGRKQAAAIGSKGTQNGTAMLKELERIYNRNNAMHMTQTYYDGIFMDAAGVKYGTRVEIRIPRNFNFNL